VGHNHVITVFAEELTGADIYNIPTCGIVGIRFAVESWAQVEPGGGELLFFDYPKKHTERGQSKRHPLVKPGTMLHFFASSIIT
jgi:hypothetical protein